MKATPLIRVCGVILHGITSSGGLIPGFPLSFSAACVPFLEGTRHRTTGLPPPLPRAPLQPLPR